MVNKSNQDIRGKCKQWEGHKNRYWCISKYDLYLPKKRSRILDLVRILMKERLKPLQYKNNIFFSAWMAKRNLLLIMTQWDNNIVSKQLKRIRFKYSSFFYVCLVLPKDRSAITCNSSYAVTRCCNLLKVLNLMLNVWVKIDLCKCFLNLIVT